ncbi:MAG: tRNA pseudouridine(55) synthase TruB [Clostridia bacterium]|nr:tRNA pseudouridine(55) synthase TruB [Clostridia bacterium]
MTSFSAVARIKRLSGEKRVGHTGTLDPMATGVLPVLIGRATALSSYLLDADKRYVATVLFGRVTDTGDVTGETIETNDVNITDTDIDRAIEHFTGEITQVPPMYSAIKKNGVPLYKLARQGKTVEVEPRNVTIYSIKKIGNLENNVIKFDVTCSKGTYIRSLCQDIGEFLGCGATLAELDRTATSGFSLADCVNLEDLTEENIAQYIKPSEEAVKNFRYANISEKQAIRFLNGGQLSFDRLYFKSDIDGEIVRVKHNNELLGLGVVDKANGQLAVKCIVADQPKPKTAVALGTFDGVHSGHKAVIKNAVDSGLKPLAVTFDTPPKAYFDASVRSIMTTEQKTELLGNLGIKKTVYLDCDEFRDYSPVQFLDYLKDELHCAFISCGFNYRFGKNGAGDTETLKEYCRQNNIGLAVSEPVYDGDQIISSTFLRSLLAEGRVEEVLKLCGHPFTLKTKVIHGDARGRTIGFPTINQIYPMGLTKLKFGVYETNVNIDGKVYKGITNIGIRPTFQNDFVSAETFILGFEGDLYGEELAVQFIKFIRDEKKFDGIDDLISAIKQDLNKIEKEQQ